MNKTKTVSLYFLGGPNDCKIIKRLDGSPKKYRYICTTEGYHVYDCDDDFVAVEEVTKWNK